MSPLCCQALQGKTDNRAKASLHKLHEINHLHITTSLCFVCQFELSNEQLSAAHRYAARREGVGYVSTPAGERGLMCAVE